MEPAPPKSAFLGQFLLIQHQPPLLIWQIVLPRPVLDDLPALRGPQILNSIAAVVGVALIGEAVLARPVEHALAVALRLLLFLNLHVLSVALVEQQFRVLLYRALMLVVAVLLHFGWENNIGKRGYHAGQNAVDVVHEQT